VKSAASALHHPLVAALTIDAGTDFRRMRMP